MNEESKPFEPTAADAPPSDPTRKRPWWLPVAVLLVVFLVGFVPMWLKSGRLNAELSRTQTQVRAQEIQIVLADAALDARRGDYEPARQRLAVFFALVQAEVDRGSGSALSPAAIEGLKPLLAQRDDLITLLARGDPASAERLATVHTEFRKTLAADSRSTAR